MLLPLPEDSDIIYLDAVGMELIIVNSYQIIKDLFDGRSSKYSGRSSFTMVNELMGFDWTMPTLPYNNKWKDQRRMLARYFGPNNTQNYQPRIVEFVRKALPSILDDPENFMAIIKQCVPLLAIKVHSRTNLHSSQYGWGNGDINGIWHPHPPRERP
mgnify:FL=1